MGQQQQQNFVPIVGITQLMAPAHEGDPSHAEGKALPQWSQLFAEGLIERPPSSNEGMRKAAGFERPASGAEGDITADIADPRPLAPTRRRNENVPTSSSLQQVINCSYNSPRTDHKKAHMVFLLLKPLGIDCNRP